MKIIHIYKGGTSPEIIDGKQYLSFSSMAFRFDELPSMTAQGEPYMSPVDSDEFVRALQTAYNESNKGYNGWTNYETWNVYLWIGNDEDWYKSARAIVAITNDPETELREWYENILNPGEDTITGPAADLLGHALRTVNCREVVDHLKEG